MKKYVVSICITVISLLTFAGVHFAESNFSNAHIATHDHHKHMEKLIDSDELESLMEKGYSKREIIIAAHIAKSADKKVEDVLTIYKQKNQSWEATAKHFGIKMDKYKHLKHKECEYFEKNREAIIQSVAKYSGKTPEQIKAYLGHDHMTLRFVIAGAALSKLSNKDLDEIIAYRKKCKTLYEIMDELDIDEDLFHKEMKKILAEVKVKK